MNADFLAIDRARLLGDAASHPLARLVARLPLSCIVAAPGLSTPGFAAVTRRWTMWISALLLACSLPRAHAESPLDIEGVVKVSAEDVVRLFESTPGLVIIDSRLADGPSSGRAQGYIEGSISLPDIRTDCPALARALPTKDTPALFYCNGVKCGRSAKAIAVAQRCGYRKLYWFRGGFEEWREKDYPYVKH